MLTACLGKSRHKLHPPGETGEVLRLPLIRLSRCVNPFRRCFFSFVSPDVLCTVFSKLPAHHSAFNCFLFSFADFPCTRTTVPFCSCSVLFCSLSLPVTIVPRHAPSAPIHRPSGCFWLNKRTKWPVKTTGSTFIVPVLTRSHGGQIAVHIHRKCHVHSPVQLLYHFDQFGHHGSQGRCLVRNFDCVPGHKEFVRKYLQSTSSHDWVPVTPVTPG